MKWKWMTISTCTFSFFLFFFPISMQTLKLYFWVWLPDQSAFSNHWTILHFSRGKKYRSCSIESLTIFSNMLNSMCSTNWRRFSLILPLIQKENIQLRETVAKEYGREHQNKSRHQIFIHLCHQLMCVLGQIQSGNILKLISVLSNLLLAYLWFPKGHCSCI